MKDLVVGDRRARNNLIEIWNGFEWVVQTKANALTGEQPMNHEGDLRKAGNVLQLFTNDAWVDVRVTSDYERGRADMLEQVIEWLEDVAGYDLIYPNDCDNLIQHLKKAMRPQEGNS